MSRFYRFPTLALAIFGCNLILCIVLLNEALLWQTISLASLLLVFKTVCLSYVPNKVEGLHSNWIKNIGAILLALVVLPELGSAGLLNSMVNLLFSGAVMWWFTANHNRTAWGTQLLVGITLLASVSLIYQQSLEYALLVFITISASIVGLYQIQQFEYGSINNSPNHVINNPANSQTSHPINYSANSLAKNDAGNLTSGSSSNTSKQENAYLPPHFFTMIVICLLGATVMFVVMPSLSPFWKLPQQKVTPTGISDSMTPGDIANVAKSSRLAFRAEFSGDKKPPHAELYWRVLTMEEFNGKTWRQSDSKKWTQNKQTKTLNSFLVNTSTQAWSEKATLGNYSIVAEPNQQPWLYSIGTSTSDDSNIYLTRDNRLIRNTKVTQRIKYSATQYSQYNKNALALTQEDIANNVKLPSFGLSRTQVLSDELWQQANGDAERYNRVILEYLATSGFQYSLSPPTLSGDHIDNFLFDVKVGFCAHFASAHAVLLRLKNIPARIITGYHGGEYNPNGNYFNIYDSSAHAWVEFSSDNKQWQHADPTSVVSPLRISEGLEQALNVFDETNDSNLNIVKQTPWLNTLRQHLQSLDYYWTVFVLDFDQQKRDNLISSLVAKLSFMKVAILVVTIGVLLGSWYLFIIIKNKPKLPTSQKLLKRLYLRLARSESRTAFNKNADTKDNYRNWYANQNLTLTQHQVLLQSLYPHRSEDVVSIIKTISIFLYSKNSSGSYKVVCNKIDLI